MLCRAINAWAPAVNVSASASKVVDSAFASNARTRARIRSSAPDAGVVAEGRAIPGSGPSTCRAGSVRKKQSTASAPRRSDCQSSASSSRRARTKVRSVGHQRSTLASLSCAAQRGSTEPAA